MKYVYESKRNHNKLANKVTQCYPLSWQFEMNEKSGKKGELCKNIRPAGVKSAENLDIKKIFYS